VNIPYCLRRTRQLNADRIATVHDDRSVTYREFAAEVDRSARKFITLGAKKGDRVAVLMLNRPEYLDFYFSIPLCGAAIMPLNTRWHRNEVSFTLIDSGATIVLVDDRHAPILGEIREALPLVRHLVYVGQGACPGGLEDWRSIQPADTYEFIEPGENDLAGLFYTSGTTGGPKGAMLSHRNVWSNTVHSMLSPGWMADGTVYLHAAPMFHLADASAIVGLTLLGATHCFLGTFDAEAVLQLIHKYRVTTLVLVPAMLNMVVNHPQFDRYDLSSLTRITYGASPMPVPLLQLAMRKLNAEFVQGYGMTELSPVATRLDWEDHKLENLDQEFTPIKSAGKAIIGVEVKVVDTLDHELPAGQIGEIVCRGPNVMLGYWNRPEINAEVLRGGWMHTGDLGVFDEKGFLYIRDRKKDMIKSGSENIYSPEVESVVSGHPAVLEAAVIGIPDPKWGETVRAVVVLRPDAAVTEAELIAWCRERLTHFKCPSSVVFTGLLPKGGTGKVQKNILRSS
jgi:acyl-CoA synthetase (AMP-forming)/AMP-acid ligase II